MPGLTHAALLLLGLASLHAYGAVARRGRSGSSAVATARFSSADPGRGRVDLTTVGSSNASATVRSGDRAQTVRAGSSGPRGFDAVNSSLDELADGPETGRFPTVCGPESVSEPEPESGFEPSVEDPSGLIPASPPGATAPEPAGDAGGGEGEVQLSSATAAASEDGAAECGRLEVFHRGGWGTVCDINDDIHRSGRDVPQFNRGAADMACRQLGFQQGFQIQALVHMHDCTHCQAATGVVTGSHL